MTYRLVITSVASGREHVVDLDRDVVLVGRRAGVDVPLPHPEVGGVHFRIERQAGTFQLVDGGAASGTRLNGEPLPPGSRRPLEDDAVIVVGTTFSLRFVARAPAGAAPTPEEGEMGTAAMARAMVRDVLAALGRSDAGDAPSLEVTAGPAKGTTIGLPAPGRELVLGRGESCEAMIVDADLSREHLRLRRDWAGASVCELGSKNGSLLDGVRLVPGVEKRLQDGATLVAGGTTLRYRDPAGETLASLQEAPPPAPAPVSTPAPAPRGRPTLVLAILLVLAAGAALVFLLRSF